MVNWRLLVGFDNSRGPTTVFYPWGPVYLAAESRAGLESRGKTQDLIPTRLAGFNQASIEREII